MSLKKKNHNARNKKKSKKWYNHDLWMMRKTFDYKRKQLTKYPHDPQIKWSFFKYKSCKFKRRKYKSDLIDKLGKLFKNDPKRYWSLLDQLKENKNQQNCEISPNEMQKHFSELNIMPQKFQPRADEIAKNIR